MIVATIPYFNEPADVIVGARAALNKAGIVHRIYEGGIVDAGGARFGSEAAMRRHGLELAREAAGEWWLQNDCDERIQNGHLLPAMLAAWTQEHPRQWAYPLPYLHESGTLTLAPFKLVHIGAELVAHSDYFTPPKPLAAEVHCLSGYTAADKLRELLLAGPYLLHAPSVRVHHSHERLSEVELELEPRPAAVGYPLPDPPIPTARETA